jgi:hypothetical protein
MPSKSGGKGFTPGKGSSGGKNPMPSGRTSTKGRGKAAVPHPSPTVAKNSGAGGSHGTSPGRKV